MATEDTDKCVNDFIERVMNSDDVREAELIHELTRHEMGDHPINRLQDILDEHLFQYEETPRWEKIVDALLEGYAFRSARTVVLSIEDESLSLHLRYRCFARMLDMGLRPQAQRILN